MDLQDAMHNLEGFTAFGGGVPTAFSSPLIHGSDLDVSSALVSNQSGTVSPAELHLSEQFSAPNSSSFTNLTTPSNFGGSPDFDTYDVSPNFGDYDAAGNSENWYSLFPDSVTTHPLSAHDKSPMPGIEELDVIEPEPQPRRKSSHSPSVSSNHGRHSSVSGVNARRRDKPLPPIVVDDPNDTVAMKRARNTLAARKSRERKAQKMDDYAQKLEDYEKRIAELEKDRDHWKRIALSGSSGA